MATAGNVSVAKPKTSGAVFVAPVGTALPTAADGTLNAAFKELGFVSDDGLTNSNSVDSDTIKAWGGQVVLVTSSEKQDTFTLTLIESLNPEVLKTVYGDGNVVVDDTNHTISVTVDADDLPEKSYVIDMALNGGAMKRIVIPNGSITETGEITYKDDEAVGYELTISAMPDSSGNNHYEYIKLAT